VSCGEYIKNTVNYPTEAFTPVDVMRGVTVKQQHALQVRGENVSDRLLPPSCDSLSHRRFQFAADWDDTRFLRGGRRMVVTRP